MLRCLHNCMPNEWNLKSECRSLHVEDRVGHIDSHIEFVDENEAENVHWDDVDDEVVASPCSHHVEIAERAEDSPFD